jgi:hypothetical protein
MLVKTAAVVSGDNNRDIASSASRSEISWFTVHPSTLHVVIITWGFAFS